MGEFKQSRTTYYFTKNKPTMYPSGRGFLKGVGTLKETLLLLQPFVPCRTLGDVLEATFVLGDLFFDILDNRAFSLTIFSKKWKKTVFKICLFFRLSAQLNRKMILSACNQVHWHVRINPLRVNLLYYLFSLACSYACT